MKVVDKTIKLMRWILAVFLFFFGTVTMVSLWNDINLTESMYSEMARESAKALFTEIIATREWNARHGGVYVIVKDGLSPNPYLKDPLKNIQSLEGMRLTKVNPAYMTRMISEVMKEAYSIRFHITSLKPLGPKNIPDSWERESLMRFEKGMPETYIVTSNGKESLRYMAPLITDHSCLPCHSEQGYKAGDIRGGISVTIPFEPYRRRISAVMYHEVLQHGVFLIAGIVLAAIAGIMLFRSLKREKEVKYALNEVTGLLPICSHCKKIRGDKGYWERVEKYIEEHSGLQMTHGLCPDCADELYGGQEWYKKMKKKNEKNGPDSGRDT
ncbi:MAG TPA: DUF3365 domain-containing protein [Spirochaetota bacterium]|nr:DUF3365 domain-containing protein [Spirochaetota bacterium]